MSDPSPLPGALRAGSQAQISIDASREVVFDHLIDPRTYPRWLTGAQDIREVDASWPEPGARFHHQVGFGLLRVSDATTIVEVDPPRELVLLASIGPFGSALIRFELVGTHPTVVRFEEAPDAGAMNLVGATCGRWLLRASIWGRNQASLQNLRELIEEPSRLESSDAQS